MHICDAARTFAGGCEGGLGCGGLEADSAGVLFLGDDYVGRDVNVLLILGEGF